VKKFLLGLLIILAIAVLMPRKIDITVGDIGRHLKNGEVLYTTGKIIDTNYYSYTEPDYPVINHHWLSGFIFYVVYRNGGFLGLSLFFTLVMSLAVYFIFLSAKQRVGSLVSIVVLLFMLPFILSRLEIRPEGFSLLFFSIYIYVLDKYSTTKTNFKFVTLLLVFLQLIWVNVHIFFGLGPLLVFVFLFISFLQKDSYLSRRLNFLLIIVTVASIFNPWGIKGVLEPITILKGYDIPVVENRSIFNSIMLNPNSTITRDYLIFIMITVFTGLVSPLIFKKIYIQKRNYVWYGLFLLFSLLTAKVMRFVSFYGLYSVYFFSILAMGLPNFLVNARKVLKFIVPVGVLVLYISSFANPDYGLGILPNSQNAADFYKQNNLTGPILNNYDNGSYIIFYLFPNEKVFVDGRPEAYSPEFQITGVLDVIDNPETFRNLDEKYSFNTIFLPTSSLNRQTRDFIINRQQSGEWAVVYLDEHSVILVKNSRENKLVITQYEITDIQNKLPVTKLTEKTNISPFWLILIKLFS